MMGNPKRITLDEKTFILIKELLQASCLGWEDVIGFIKASRKVYLMDNSDFIKFDNALKELKTLYGGI